MSKTVGIDELSDAIRRELELYSEDIVEGIKRETKKSMTELVKETKATAPVGNRQKHYRDSIASKKTAENSRGVAYTWYVKGSDYRLSHLLEHGHAKRNGGRVAGTHFISKAYEPIKERYIKAIEEVVKDG